MIVLGLVFRVYIISNMICICMIEKCESFLKAHFNVKEEHKSFKSKIL